jgi:hypothetical protein
MPVRTASAPIHGYGALIAFHGQVTQTDHTHQVAVLEDGTMSRWAGEAVRAWTVGTAGRWDGAAWFTPAALPSDPVRAR